MSKAINNSDTKKAIVTAVHKDRYELRDADSESDVKGNFFGRLKSSIYFGKASPLFPTVGDEVLTIYNANGDSQIIETLPRKTVFLRQSMTQGEADQAVAANFDYVFLVLSLNEDFRVSKLERYAALAWQSNATPVIILTKADLCEDISYYESLVEKHVPFVAFVSVSTVTGFGMDKLEPYLQKDKIIVCLGASGVGKSSLINALYGDEVLKTNDIRVSDDQGHHTTTHRQMLPLKNGAYMIDTPGMRKMLASGGDGKEDISNSFFDIKEYLTSCRFRNCTHKKEPGCAILKAIQDGSLEQRRWDMYLSMLREEAYAKKRAQINQNRVEKKILKKQSRSKDEYLF